MTDSEKMARPHTEIELRLAQLFDRNVMPCEKKTDPDTLKPATRKRKIIRSEYPDAETQREFRDLSQDDSENEALYRQLAKKLCKGDEKEEEVYLAMKKRFWSDERRLTWGASGDGPLSGWDDYQTNIMLFLIESGRIAPPLSRESQKYFDTGHYYEDEAAEAYAIVMDAQVFHNGLVLHPVHHFKHISSDGFVEFNNPETKPHNKYVAAAGSPKRILLEIKNPYYGLYTTKNAFWNVSPTSDGIADILTGRAIIPVHYLIQLNSQCDLFQTDVDFCVQHRCKPWDPDSQPIPEKDMEGNLTGRYVIAEMLVTRYFRNQKSIQRCLNFLNQHRKHLEKKDIFLEVDVSTPNLVLNFRPTEFNEDFQLYLYCGGPEGESALNAMKTEGVIHLDSNVLCLQESQDYEFKDGRVTLKDDFFVNYKAVLGTGTGAKMNLIAMYPPKLVRHEYLPDCTILPLKWVKWIITPPPGRMSCVDLSIGGGLVGKIDVYVKNMEDQKPLRVSIKNLEDKADIATELEAIPNPDPILRRDQVKNPMIKDLLKQYPEKSVADILWEFSLGSILPRQ